MLGRDKLAVDIERTEIIYQCRNAPPAGMVEQMIEQAGFACPQKAGDDGKRGGGVVMLCSFQVFSAGRIEWVAATTPCP